MNGTEFFVHLEDVRRAEPGWTPREPDAGRDEQLWKTLGRMGRLSFRSSPVGVVLRRAGTGGAEITAKRGPDTVTLTGEPGELLLFAFGRDAAEIDFDGEQSAIARVRGLKRGL